MGYRSTAGCCSSATKGRTGTYGRTLLFFHYDDAECVDFVLPGASAYPDGFRVIYVGADEAAEPRTTPDGTEEYEAKPLVACLIRTFSSSDDDGEEEPEWFDVLQEALDELSYELTEPAGQVGGPPDSLQDPVEEEVAQAVADGQVRPELAGTFSNDAPWLLLAHFYYERHDGRLYYLIQPDDLAARRFDKVMFTWQCT